MRDSRGPAINAVTRQDSTQAPMELDKIKSTIRHLHLLYRDRESPEEFNEKGTRELDRHLPRPNSTENSRIQVLSGYIAEVRISVSVRNYKIADTGILLRNGILRVYLYE